MESDPPTFQLQNQVVSALTHETLALGLPGGFEAVPLQCPNTVLQP